MCRHCSQRESDLHTQSFALTCCKMGADALQPCVSHFFQDFARMTLPLRLLLLLPLLCTMARLVWRPGVDQSLDADRVLNNGSVRAAEGLSSCVLAAEPHRPSAVPQAHHCLGSVPRPDRPAEASHCI